MTTQALTLGQKVFNQRLLAEHCLSETQAETLYDELLGEYPDLRDSFPNLVSCIRSSNAQLRHLGLEIVAVSMPSMKGNSSKTSSSTQGEEGNEEEDDENDENGAGGRKKKSKHDSDDSKMIRYYSIVNKFPDEIAKKAWQPTIFQPLTQQAYVKKVLQTLAQDGPTQQRNTLLNLKNEVNAATDTETTTATPITLAMAEDSLDRMIAEKWIVSVKTAADVSDDTNDGGSTQRRKQGRSTTTSSGRALALGPRTYCELSYYLTDEFGIDARDLPQQIILRK